MNIVQKNMWRSYIYMMLLSSVIILLGYFVSNTFNFGLSGTGVFILIAGIIDFIAYFLSDRLVIASSHAKPLHKEQAPEFYELVARLSKTSNLKQPKLYYINEDAINAFATGRDKNHTAIIVTRGLLEKLTLHEIEGVIGHELSHINNSDTKVMAITTVLVGIISIIADVYWRANLIGKVANKDRTGIMSMITVFLALIAPISATLIKLAISRKREFAADAMGAHLVKNPHYLASALEKISRDQLPLPQATRVTSSLYISNPFKSDDFFDKLFSTHPPIEERIKLLTNIKL
jgi:heat shock protein HtpX